MYCRQNLYPRSKSSEGNLYIFARIKMMDENAGYTNQPHYPSEYVLSNPFLTGDANVVFITYFFFFGSVCFKYLCKGFLSIFIIPCFTNNELLPMKEKKKKEQCCIGVHLYGIPLGYVCEFLWPCTVCMKINVDISPYCRPICDT